MASKLKIGVIATLADNVKEELEKVSEFGLPTCQLVAWDRDEQTLYTNDNAAVIKQCCDEYGIEITTLWAGYPGPAVWNFTEGPITIGLVPDEYRDIRVDALIRGAEFAAGLGLESITTHVGFVPENPNDPYYKKTVDALTKVVSRCKELGLYFCFETGQETPITLLRTITDIGLDNMGVNFDPANLLMYGKANPIDALDILGSYVKGVHAKDGEYPTSPLHLGCEQPLGEGRVDFPRFIAKLKTFGYSGALTIEREISGDEQIRDIKKAIEILEPLC